MATKVLILHHRGTIKLPAPDGPVTYQEGEIAFDGVKFAFVGQGGTPAEIVTGQLRQYRVIDPNTDAVPGQVNTYYIEKIGTPHGHNVVVGPDGKPLIRLVVNQAEWLLGDQYNVVRSMSSGGEGPAAVGSLNAVTLNQPIPPGGVWTIWITYQRKDQATA